MKTLFIGCSKICFTPLFPSRDSYKNRLWRESGAPLRGMEAVGPWTLSMNLLAQLPSFYSMLAIPSACRCWLWGQTPVCVPCCFVPVLCLPPGSPALRTPLGSYPNLRDSVLSRVLCICFCLLACFIQPSTHHSFIQQVLIQDYFVPELAFSDDNTFPELMF